MARPARGSRETSIRPWHPDANGQRFSLYDEAARITQDSAKSAPGFWHYRYVDYDQSGNVTLTRVYEADPDGNQVWDAQASFYDAAEQLRLVNRAIGPYANDETHPGQRNVYEEYRYDALGRRVLRRSRRTSSCTASSAECASSIERTVWDGDQMAFEIRAKGGTSEGPGTLEMDHLTYTGTDGLGLGQVAYVHAGALDQPVTVYRMGFNGSSTPIKVHPHPNWRGLYEFGTTNTGAVQSSPAIAWPGGQATVDGQVWTPTDGPAWFGNLISGKADGSGLQYMRNRYYDPATGRFTQEDPHRPGGRDESVRVRGGRSGQLWGSVWTVPFVRACGGRRCGGHPDTPRSGNCHWGGARRVDWRGGRPLPWQVAGHAFQQ